MQFPEYDSPNRNVSFGDLVGKTLTEVRGQVGGLCIDFITADGDQYHMWHEQDCCESVRVEDICGEWDEIIGEPILKAEENSNNDWPADKEKPEYMESNTWTYYRISTMRGQVVIRWWGSSNGYYSESVSFCKYDK